MDRIKENESENTTVRALVVNVTYKVSLSMHRYLKMS